MQIKGFISNLIFFKKSTYFSAIITGIFIRFLSVLAFMPIREADALKTKNRQDLIELARETADRIIKEYLKNG